MYQIVVQLKDMSRNYGEVMHQIESMHYRSIEEAFKSIDSGKEMFDRYIAIDAEVKKSIEDIKSK